MQARRPVFGPIVRLVACAAIVYHMVAITVANVPPQTALGPGVHAPFAGYLRVLGLWQQWSMFTTAPHFLDVDAQLVSHDADGHEAYHGVMLPGLGDYVHDLRVHAFFVRLTYDQAVFLPQMHRYLFAACRAIERTTGTRPVSVQLEVHAEKLRRLDEVRRDGRIADVELHRFGEVTCPR